MRDSSRANSSAAPSRSSSQANPAAWGLGLPTGLALTGLALDALRHRRVDGVFVGAALLLILSFPARIAPMATPVWGRSSAWLASLVD